MKWWEEMSLVQKFETDKTFFICPSSSSPWTTPYFMTGVLMNNYCANTLIYSNAVFFGIIYHGTLMEFSSVLPMNGLTFKSI